MNEQDTSRLFQARLKIVHNAAKLVKYGGDEQKSAGIGQMSLFQDAEMSSKPEMDDFDDEVDLLQMSLKEAELIGVQLTYDIMQKYLIHYKTYVTHSIQEINELVQNAGNIVTIGMVTSLVFNTGASGKPYIKMIISDKGYDMTIYINGKNYDKFKTLFKNHKVYMFSLIKNTKNGYVNIMHATEIGRAHV